MLPKMFKVFLGKKSISYYNIKMKNIFNPIVFKF